MTAEPVTVAFGMVASGQTVVHTVALLGKTPATLNGVRVDTRAKWLTARIVPPSAVSARTTVEITVLPAAPVGLLQDRVSVHLTNGQRLDIPVIAFVQQAKNPAP